MTININFNQQEKIDFLTLLGYNIYTKTVSNWEQWGNHDSQGDWVDQTVMYAKSNKLSATEDSLENIFKREIEYRLKSLVLGTGLTGAC
jgi:hypothetical protein